MRPPIFRVQLRACRYPLHGLSLDHLYPPPGMALERGPIAVSRLDDGSWFVQDGRHRVIRALLRGDVEHDAIDHDLIDQHERDLDRRVHP